MRKHDLMWAAGLFDGEGCISVRLNNPTKTSKHKSKIFSLVIKVTMCHEATILRLHSIFNRGHLTVQKRDLPWHDAYSWVCMSDDALKVLNEIGPFLFTKKEEYIIAKEFMDIPGGRSAGRPLKPEVTLVKERIYLKLREQKHTHFYPTCGKIIEQPGKVRA